MNNLKKQLLNGFFSNFVARYSNYFIQLIITAILSRLLTPREFGIVAVVTVFLTFFQILGDIGIGTAIVQYDDLEHDDITVLILLMLLVAIIISFLFFASRQLISSYFNNDSYSEIIKYLSIVSFININSIVPKAILRRDKRFFTLGIIDVIASSLSGIGAIFLAKNNFGYFSLIYKSIFQGTIVFLLVMPISKIQFRKITNIKVIKRISRYSQYQFFADLINYFARNLDNLLIGKYLGETSLGFYEKSYRLMLLPLQLFSYVINSVLHPVLKDYKNEKKYIEDVYGNLICIMSIIGFSLTGFLFINANNIVIFIFGDQWNESVKIFKILSLSIAFQMVTSTAAPIFQLSERTDLLFLSGLVNSINICIFIIIGVIIGSVEQVAINIVVSYIISFIFTFYLLYKHIFVSKYMSFIFKVLKRMVYGLVIFVSTLLINRYIDVESRLLDLIINFSVSICVLLFVLILSGEIKYIKKIMH